MNDYFEAELEQYMDMNSSLTLEDLRSNDGTVEITCGVIQSAGDLSRITVTAYVDWYLSNPTVSTRLVFVGPGRAQIVLTKPSELDVEEGPVDIDVVVTRRPNGSFDAGIVVQSGDLW